jgi:S-adenosylmethionine:tRNA ribosyltransferase-isomerase
MKLSDFDYNLPKKLIAQEPVKPRDHSRLLIVSRRGTTNSAHANYFKECKIEHKHFYDIADYLKKGDVLVLNNSKVFPARLIGRKMETGGKIEVFLLNSLTPSSPAAAGSDTPLLIRRGERGEVWQCLLGGHGRKEGLEVEFGPESSEELRCKVMKDNNDGTWEVKFNKPHKKMMEIVGKIGEVPLPPYIKRPAFAKATADKDSYQTIYADNKKIGSVAAPTAGFHFTPRLIKKLKKKGVQFECITLHVGLGTFAPVKVKNIKKHKMHAEMVEIKKEVAQRIIKAKKEGRRIIAVGTTSVRTLEGCLSNQINYPINKIENRKSKIENFIYPSYKFKVVDAIITNFHLPKSTLLMLVSAFAGKKQIDKAYKEAIKKKYRFYSYGDAMFIK